MISICIPVYNYDAGKLIADLVLQASLSEINIEINILNDGSEISFTQKMRKCTLKNTLRPCGTVIIELLEL